MWEYVRALIKDFVATVELAAEDGAGFPGELAEDFDALALAVVVGVGEALWDLLGEHERDQLRLFHQMKILLIIIIFHFATAIVVIIKMDGIIIIQQQMVASVQRLPDLIWCGFSHHEVEVYQPTKPLFATVGLGASPHPSYLFVGAGTKVESLQVARFNGTGSADRKCSQVLLWVLEDASCFIMIIRALQRMLLQYLLSLGLTGGEKGGLGGLHPEHGVAGYEVI